MLLGPVFMILARRDRTVAEILPVVIILLSVDPAPNAPRGDPSIGYRDLV